MNHLNSLLLYYIVWKFSQVPGSYLQAPLFFLLFWNCFKYQTPFSFLVPSASTSSGLFIIVSQGSWVTVCVQNVLGFYWEESILSLFQPKAPSFCGQAYYVGRFADHSKGWEGLVYTFWYPVHPGPRASSDESLPGRVSWKPQLQQLSCSNWETYCMVRLLPSFAYGREWNLDNHVLCPLCLSEIRELCETGVL